MSGLIPQPFITELLNRTDLVELVDGYVPLKKRGKSFLACCPFHNEKTPSFNVVAEKQFYHCFGCGANGNAISFIMNYLHQSFIDAIETLALRVGLQVPREKHSAKQQQTGSLYTLLTTVCRFYQQTLKSQGEQAIVYLRQRGLTGEIAKRYELGYAPAGWHSLEKQFKSCKTELIATGMLIQREDGKTYDRYRDRIMFPIHDRLGRIIGFGGRTLDDQQKPKYLNSPETIIFQKNRELYGLHQLIQDKTTIDNIVIVEGYLDVIALAQHGITNVVAALGTATSTYHIQLLSKYTKQLIFCFDGDEAGRQAAWRALENTLPQLNTGIDAHFIFLPTNHDPDSLVREEGRDKFKERLLKATPLSQFFLDTLAQDCNLRTVAGKTQLINRIKPYMNSIPEGPYKQLLIDEISRLTHLENHRINQILVSQDNPKKEASQKRINRSPLRLAIAILIQNPQILRELNHEISLDGNDQEILQTLLNQIASFPDINTATLLELWRNSEMFDSLGKLASWDHQVPDEAVTKEFFDILIFLQKQNLEDKICHYLAKSRKEGLTDCERQLLQDMLKQRHHETS